MIEGPIETISAADILRLVERRVAEGRTLEFKRDLPAGRDDDVKEFLADVTALANSNGGDLIFGVGETDGAAASLHPISGDGVDKVIQRFEDLLKDGVEPRLAGVRPRWIETGPKGGVIILRIPASLSAPHRVIAKKSSRFWARHSLGKYEMDTHQLRQAFLGSEEVPARLRALHGQAVSASFGQNMPFRLASQPGAVATVVPLSALRETRTLDITFDNALLPRLTDSGYFALNTLEGLLTHTPVLSPTPSIDQVEGWALTHWRGWTDYAWSIGRETEGGRGQMVKYVWPKKFEDGLLDTCRATIAKLNALGIEGPWAILVTVTGIDRFELVLGDHETSRPAWRGTASLPELIIDHVNEATIEPVLRTFWLLFGEARPSSRG
jgi:hypothetical protein